MDIFSITMFSVNDCLMHKINWQHFVQPQIPII